jgi:hypothetical protein
MENGVDEGKVSGDEERVNDGAEVTSSASVHGGDHDDRAIESASIVCQFHCMNNHVSECEYQKKDLFPSDSMTQ